MIPWGCHSLPHGFGIRIAGEDHILERQGWALVLHGYLLGALVACERVKPELASLSSLIKALALVASLHLGRDQILHRPPVLTGQGSLNVAILRHPLETIGGIVLTQIGGNITQLVKLAAAGTERVQISLGLRGGGRLLAVLQWNRCKVRIHCRTSSFLRHRRGRLCNQIGPNAIFLAGMLTASRPTDSTYRTTCPHPYQAALDRARHDPLHRVDISGGHLVEGFVDGVLLHPLLQGFADTLTCRTLACPFQHTTCCSLASQHLEQHGVAHHGAHGGSSPHLGITHGGAAGQVGRFLPGQPQLFLIREMGGLLILVDASKRLAEGVAGRQLVKAHAQHGVTSVHPRTAD